MKKKFILLSAICGLFGLMLSSYSSGPGLMSYERTGVSGSVGCGPSGCHSASATAGITVTMQLMSGATAVTSYSPGGSYTIRITGTNTTSTTGLTKFGYQVTAMKGTSTTVNAGTMTAPSGSHIATVSGIKIAEHSSPLAGSGSGGSGTIYQVDVPWTAPVAGTGTVKLRGVVNAVNNNGSADVGDKWNSASADITESTSTAPITGTLSVCVGATTALADATTGGTWSSSATAIATVNPTTGVVTGVAPGTSTISYAATAGTVTAVVTVNANPAAITGVPVVCPGGVTTLADATAGGTWSSSATSIATVSAAGVVNGVTSGSAIITYALSTGCYDTAALTVTTVPAITGTASMCIGGSATLSHIAPGGSWSSSAPAVATVASVTTTTAAVSGVSAGTSNITYAFGTSGCYATTVATVNGVPVATITGPSTVCMAHTVTLTGAPTGGTWTSSNTAKATVGASTGIVSGVATGSVTISYKVTTACGSDSTTKAMTVAPASPCVSGISNPFAANDELKLYPNPNRGSFSLNVLATIDEDAHIIVTNIIGAKVREFSIKTNEVNNITLDQPAGVYFLSATTLSNKYFVKIVVE